MQARFGLGLAFCLISLVGGCSSGDPADPEPQLPGQDASADSADDAAAQDGAAPDSPTPDDAALDAGPDHDLEDGASDSGELDAAGDSDAAAPGCGFPPSGQAGNVAASLVDQGDVLLEVDTLSQNLTDPWPNPQSFPLRGHLRRGPCGTVGQLVIDLSAAAGNQPDLLYFDVTQGASPPEIVKDDVSTNAQEFQLFYDETCRPFVVGPEAGIPYVQLTRTAANTWVRTVPALSLTSLFPGEPTIAYSHVGGDVSADGTLHLFLEAGPFDSLWVVHGTRAEAAGSEWTFTKEMLIPAKGALQYRVDGDGGIHAIYKKTEYPCDPCDLGLYYAKMSATASNEEVVQESKWGAPNDELAVGAFLALDPTGEPWVVGRYETRATTGSLIAAELRFYGRIGDQWCGDTLFAAADGYAGGDGAQFTGGDPHLSIDDGGRFHVVFTDLAAWHDAHGSNVVSGQVRYAVRAGSDWRAFTLFEQEGQSAQAQPLHMMSYPTVLPSADGTAVHVAGLERVWDTDSIYNTSAAPVTFRARSWRASVSLP